MAEAVIGISLGVVGAWAFHQVSCWLIRLEKKTWNARCHKAQERRLKEYAENERK